MRQGTCQCRPDGTLSLQVVVMLGMYFWNFVSIRRVEIQEQISDGFDSGVLVGLYKTRMLFCNDMHLWSEMVFWRGAE